MTLNELRKLTQDLDGESNVYLQISKCSNSDSVTLGSQLSEIETTHKNTVILKADIKN